jgi:thiamine pyrophosphokinase
MNEKDAVALASGDFPSHALPVAALARYRTHVFCCDGAADALLKAGYMPRKVIGDCDSLSHETRVQLADRLICIAEQEDNDLTKTVRYCATHGYRRLLILGATGKREDHTLGNISLLADYMDFAEVEMWTDYGIFTPVRGDATFESRRGQQVSVFCMEAFPLTLGGLRWPVENRVLTRWWQASLNEALADRFEVHAEGKAIVFRKYDES